MNGDLMIAICGALTAVGAGKHNFALIVNTCRCGKGCEPVMIYIARGATAETALDALKAAGVAQAELELSSLGAGEMH